MLVLRKAQFKIYVYPEDYEGGPHCHVIFNDDSEVSVDIPLIKPRYDAILLREVRVAIEENIELICESYEKINPPRIYKKNKKKEK
jgi:hypothetical protein